MGTRFTIGHVGGGTKKVDVPSKGVDAVLDSLLRELHASNDEHYQGYVINSAEASMTIFDGGLMSLDGSMGDSGPASRARAFATSWAWRTGQRVWRERPAAEQRGECGAS